mgnify:CR=1 FL=1
MKKLFIYLREYKKECVFAPLFKMLEASFELFVPLVVAAIIDTGIAHADKGYVIRMCLLLFLLALIGLTCAVTAQYFSAKAAVGFATKLRHALFSHLQGLSFSEVDTIGTSTMITRMTSDINLLQNGVNMALRLFLRSPFVVFGAMIMAFTIDFKAALSFVGAIILLSIVVFGIMYLNIPMMKSVQAKLDDVLLTARENLTGIRVIRAFCKEDEELARFRQKNEELTRMQKKSGSISGLTNPLTYVIINFAIIVLIWTGALQVQKGILTQGQVMALYNYMSQILVELIKMANLIITLTKAAACGDRVASVLSVKSTQKDGEKTPALDAPHGSVVFDGVSMRYAGAGTESVSGVSFTAAPGSTVGVIGGTGSGKSTLVNLIPRFYDVTGGRVLVDGMDVRDIRKEELRRRIGVVPQKAMLFKGTIRSNLLWGNADATEADLNDALKVAQALDVVSSKSKGLDEPVEQGGRNFSGGQRQRLTIARALVRKPEILILDDSASALDYATDANLRRAIRQMENPPTTFIVSQRAASVRFADQIIVLDDGHVAGMGTHDELLASCPVYQEIYASQFKKEGK